MIADLKPYPAMKDSGVPWVGKVPEHWHVQKLRHILRRVTERNRADLPLLSVVREKGVIRRDTTNAEENRNFIPDDLSNYKVVRVAQFAMNKMKAWQGSYGVSQFDGIVSPAYFVFDVTGVEGLFFHSAIRSRAYVPSFTQASDGVRIGQWDLAEARMREIAFVVPPLAEQDAIVRFLDHANRRIERYIRAKKKVIALLNEQKQAIIHRAVTRGLDPSVRSKPSGIPWLGEIPEHWENRRLRTLVSRIEQGVSPQAEAFLADDFSWGVLKAGCVNRGLFRETEHKRLSTGFSIDPSIVVKIGDVLVSRASGSPQLVGSAGKVEALSYRLILSDKIFRPIFRDFVSVDFTVYAMNSTYYRYQVEQAISGAEGLANNLPLSSLRDFRLAMPPTEEAHRIATMLRDKVSQFDTAINRAEREIALIREYRTRLVADVVTGKIDVREVAAKLPEEPGEEAIELIEELTENEVETSEFEEVAGSGTIG